MMEKISPQTGRWILTATILASSMAFIDGTALNIVLSDIQDSFHASGAEMLWIVDGYLLFLASLILVGGSIGDHFGRKRVFMIGIALFTIASFLCGISPTTELMIAARMFQGVGGALMVPGSLAIISASFPIGERGKAIGTWSAFSSVTTLLGPVLGGAMAEVDFWRGIFFINLPLAAVALWILIKYVPESRDEQAQKLDFIGALLITVGLAGLSYAFIEAPGQGFDSPVILAGFIIGFAALILFVWVE
ncbi:MAG: MFS transporter, partial [Taibaiella sp.]|nr:MFS transporter [Taibaiella sp.]